MKNVNHSRPLTTERQAAPIVINQFSMRELDSFVNWTREAMEFWPMSAGAKVVVDMVLAWRSVQRCNNRDVSTRTLDGFIDWTSEAVEYCDMSNDVKKVVAMFTAYRDKEKERQEQARQELRNYWL